MTNARIKTPVKHIPQSYSVIAELLRTNGARADAHNLEHLVTHRSKKIHRHEWRARVIFLGGVKVTGGKRKWFGLNSIFINFTRSKDSFHLKYNLMHLKVKPYDILVYAQDCDSSADLSNSEIF